MRVLTGLDILEKKWPKILKGARVGLLVHPASVNQNLIHAVEIFLQRHKCELKALFGPQHGIRGETQDNMVEWRGFRDKKTGIPVYSLYGDVRTPEPSMLKNVDVFVIDLQDVGSRYYTFIWTMDLCMHACNELGKAVVVLDRPNPLGGKISEGPVLNMAFSSFVGLKQLPVRHGMSIAEIACLLRDTFYPSLHLSIVPMLRWKRRMWFDETGLPWIFPSPNMPTLATATVYPGMCLMEGTHVSEGRGTTVPFELFGTPYIDPDLIVAELRTMNLRGIVFRPAYFQPAFQKYSGQLCGGAHLYVSNRNTFKPFLTGVAIIKTIYKLYPRHFRWKKPPYEYERKKLPFDILAGTDTLRRDIEQGRSLKDMEIDWNQERYLFNRNVRKHYLIYG